MKTLIYITHHQLQKQKDEYTKEQWLSRPDAKKKVHFKYIQALHKDVLVNDELHTSCSMEAFKIILPTNVTAVLVCVSAFSVLTQCKIS